MTRPTFPVDRYAIVGVGETAYTADCPQTPLAMVAEAVTKAADDAGTGIHDVDAILHYNQLVTHMSLATALGLPDLSYWGTSGIGGYSPCPLLAQAVAALDSGLATTVLLFHVIKSGSTGRIADFSSVPAPEFAGGDGTYAEYFTPYGLFAPGYFFAMAARRHMLDFGTKPEHLGNIAIACRNNANRNPSAQMHSRPLDMATYFGSRIIADPLRLYDFCPRTDVAGAIIITDVERARDLRQPVVKIRSAAMGAGPDVGSGAFATGLLRDTITSMPPSQHAARRVFGAADVKPEDIDVAQIYDCFTPTVLMQLEDYGFCSKGDGGAFTEDANIELGGRLPVNTAGGNLSQGYLQGLNHLIEGTHQIRGTSCSQVEDAELCLVTSGTPGPTGAAILSR